MTRGSPKLFSNNPPLPKGFAVFEFTTASCQPSVSHFFSTDEEEMREARPQSSKGTMYVNDSRPKRDRVKSKATKKTMDVEVGTNPLFRGPIPIRPEAFS